MKYHKNKLHKTLDCRFRDMLNFDFLEKDLGIVCPQHVQMFLMLYSPNWPNFIVWLLLLLEILGNMCMAIVFVPDSDVINFKINLGFLIKPFFYLIKKSRWKFRYLEIEKNFQGEMKSIFHNCWKSSQLEKIASQAIKKP